jgi:hypothetical protein
MNKDPLELSDAGGFSWPCERRPEAVRSGIGARVKASGGGDQRGPKGQAIAPG